MPQTNSKAFLYRDKPEVIEKIKKKSSEMNINPVHVIRLAVREFLKIKKG